MITLGLGLGVGADPCLAEDAVPTSIAQIGDWRVLLSEFPDGGSACLALRASDGMLQALTRVGESGEWQWYFRPGGPRFQPGARARLELQFDQSSAQPLQATARSPQTLMVPQLPVQLLVQLLQSEQLVLRLGGRPADRLNLLDLRAVMARLIACQRANGLAPIRPFQTLDRLRPFVATSSVKGWVAPAELPGQGVHALPPDPTESLAARAGVRNMVPVQPEAPIPIAALPRQRPLRPSGDQKGLIIAREDVLERPDAQANRAEAPAPTEEPGAALSRAKERLAKARQELGPAHPDTLRRLADLAFRYYVDARYADATPLLQQALEGYQEALGPRHEHVGVLKSYLASAYKHQGRYEEAESLYSESLALAESTLGETHPETLMSQNSLALLYQEQGRYSQAEGLYNTALDRARQALGAGHDIIVALLGNLAGLYSSWGRHSMAADKLQELVALKDAELGPDHPQTALAMLDLAKVYRDQGRYSDAEPLFDRALPMLRRRLGSRHPEVLIAENNLAGLYGLQGRYEEAEPLLRQGTERLSDTLGEHHPDVATGLNNLALVYRALGEPQTARRLHSRALDIHLGRFKQGLAGEQQAEWSSAEHDARHHALAYLQLLARLPHPDVQAQSDMLTAVQLAQGPMSESKVAALAERLTALHRTSLQALPATARGLPSHAEPLDRLRLAGLGRTLIDLASLEAELGPDDAVLAWALGPEESYLLQLSRAGEAKLTPLAITEDEIADQLLRLISARVSALVSGQGLVFPAALANELFEQLFGPDWQQDLKGVKRLLLIPDGPLTRLGFPLLLTQPPEQSELAIDDAAYDTAPWLARQFDIVVLPNLSALAVVN